MVRSLMVGPAASSSGLGVRKPMLPLEAGDPIYSVSIRGKILSNISNSTVSTLKLRT